MRHDHRRPRPAAAAVLCAAAALALGQPTRAQTLADARAFVAGLYGAYAHGQPDYLGRDAALVFAPALLRLIRRDARDTPPGDVGALDGDPICDCQDAGGLRLDRLDVRPTGPARATATAHIALAGAARRIELDLVADHGRWRIADIHTPDLPSLVRLLDPAPASPR
jgi:hypothetical protein